LFDSLSEKLGGILDRLTRRGALSEADVDAALREVRRALLEADVALDVARAFTDGIKKQAIGVEVMKSVTPGQMVVKIVHDQLVATLGGDSQGGTQGIDLNAAPPVAIMMVGLQGSGKTTTTAKIAKRLTDRQRRKVLMASLDVRRPAAMEQLAVLGRDAQIDTLPVVQGQAPPQIAKRAIEAAKLGGYDVVLLDTAGRTTLDDEMMNEAAQVKQATTRTKCCSLPMLSPARMQSISPARSTNASVCPASCSPVSTATAVAVPRSRCARSPASRSS
jgi:signal recognition particle subunit SRP54